MEALVAVDLKIKVIHQKIIQEANQTVALSQGDQMKNIHVGKVETWVI